MRRGAELLLDDARLLQRRAHDCSVESTWRQGPRGTHIRRRRRRKKLQARAGRCRRGGFEIDKSSKDGYFYVRYESLKNGYIDDLELALSDNAPYVLRVRSSSRVGFLDFNVNEKRLNRLAADLRARGWTVPEITAKTHPDYFAQNAGR